MSQKVTIAVDAMGGDHAPDVVLEGVAAALAATRISRWCCAALRPSSSRLPRRTSVAVRR